MKHSIHIVAITCILLLTGAVSPARDAQKNVLFLGLSSNDKNNIEDIKKINDLFLEDIQKTLHGRISVINLSEPYAYSVQRDIDTIAAANRSGWVIYGSVKIDEARKARVRLYLYDSTRKKDVIDRGFTTALRPNAVISSNLEYCYSYIGDYKGYFANVGNIKNTASRIAFIDFNISGDSGSEYRKLKSRLKQHMEQHLGAHLTVVKDESYPFINMNSEQYRSEKRLSAISSAIKCDWLVTGHVFRNDENTDHNVIVQLFNGRTAGYQNVIQISAPDFSTAVLLAQKRMESFRLTMSIASGYSLHPPTDMRYIRDMSFLGMSSIDPNHTTPYSVYSRGDEVVIGAYGLISRIDDSGRIRGKIGMPGSDMGEFQVPMKIDGDGSGTIFVLDTSGKKIILYDKSGSPVREIFHNAAAAQDFAVSSAGYVFVPDNQKSLILVYNSEGMHISSIHLNGETPVTITTFNGKPVIISDKDNFYCLTYLSEHGQVLRKRTMGINRSLLLISRCTMDKNENLYGVDVSKNIIFRIDKDDSVRWITSELPGNDRKYFNVPYDITVSADGNRLYVADMQNKRIVCFNVLKNLKEAKSAAVYMVFSRKHPAGSSQALYYINMALSVDPKYMPAILARAEYYSAVGHFPTAIALYEKVLQYNKNNSAAKRGLDKNRLALYGEYARFHEMNFRSALGTGPESARPHYEKSVQYYEMALKLSPADNALKSRYDAVVALFNKSQGVVEVKNAEIESISLQVLFSSLYKFYTDNPLGTAVIRNTTGHTIDRIYAELLLKDYMDFPTDSRSFRQIQPDDTVRLDLYAVFNNRILGITENTPINAQLTIRYSIKGKEYSISRNEPISVYNRNAMTWTDTRKLSSFITTRDTAVKIFSRTTAQQFRNLRPKFMNTALQNAIEIFDTLGTFGITYVRDPRTPFTTFSRQKNLVDHIQYPRETLRFRSGDCDDLTVLYCALLENLGIETALLTVPGHILMMFNTDVSEANKSNVSSDDSRLVIYKNSVWIPVETTAMGESFLTAWDKGLQQYRKFARNDQIEVITSKEAWQQYAPVTLDDDGWEPKIPGIEETDRLYHGDINTIIETELTRRIKVLENSLQQDSGNSRIYNSIGVTYSRFGKYDQARSYFEEALKLDPGYFSATNNMGNILMLEGKFDQALVFFEKARTIRPDNPTVHVNMALVYGKMNRQEKSREMMLIALRLDSSLHKQYGFMLETETLKAGKVDEADPVWADK
ncbi:MAG: hypothetical protein CVV44_22655 [Spirochaetae bacterium HGW-Spirochaetae-1]|jgi:tetratricopeptide (TPR) repeat protein|nr:MAG: hypothetical protein CVV44_22655 [Spirochaetae bacterium HGW-Spirochaetae-1]